MSMSRPLHGITHTCLHMSRAMVYAHTCHTTYRKCHHISSGTYTRLPALSQLACTRVCHTTQLKCCSWLCIFRTAADVSANASAPCLGKVAYVPSPCEVSHKAIPHTALCTKAHARRTLQLPPGAGANGRQIHHNFVRSTASGG